MTGLGRSLSLNTGGSTGGLFGSSITQPQQSNNLFASSTAKPQPTQAGSMFGGALPSQPQQQTGGLFGSTAAPQPQQSGGLFGSTAASQPAQSGGLFGAPAPQPQQQSGGLFGSTAASQSQKPGSLFSFNNVGQGGAAASTQPQTTGLFGNSTSTPQAPNTGLFGSTTATSQAPSGGLFGNSTSTGGLFGNTQASQPQVSGLFGNVAAPQAQTGGLFGNTAVAQPQSSGLFGNTTSQQKPGGLFGPSTQQPQRNTLFGLGASTQNQQLQTVPGVKIDASNIKSTTRMFELHEDLQALICHIDDTIQGAIRASMSCAGILPILGQKIEQVPQDVAYLDTKIETVEGALGRDAVDVGDCRAVVRKDQVDVERVVRAMENLRLPSQYHYGGMGSNMQSFADGEGTSTTDLLPYFNNLAEQLDARAKLYQSQIMEVESHLRTVEASAVDGVEKLMMRRNGAVNDGAVAGGEEVRELVGAMRGFEEAVLRVASRIGGVREDVVDISLATGGGVVGM